MNIKNFRSQDGECTQMLSIMISTHRATILNAAITIHGHGVQSIIMEFNFSPHIRRKLKLK